MPKRPSDAYDEGDGFVAGSGDEGSGPKSKRARVERGKKEGGKKAKGKEAGKKEGGKGGEVGGGGRRDGKGEEFWEVSPFAQECVWWNWVIWTWGGTG